MRESGRAAPRDLLRAAPRDLVAGAAFAALSVQYFASAIRLAARAPVWMDEVLALWTARLGGAGAIWAALVRGAEFNPPLYAYLLHLLLRLGLTDTLAMRFPSILAVYVAALAIGAIAWRRASFPAAAVAAGAVLSSGAFAYAVQARPYALSAAAFACALALYDRSEGRVPSWGRSAALATLLAIAIGLSSYALLLVGTLAAVELALARVGRRRPCRRTLAAVALAAASVLAWSPILLSARVASAADTIAPAYYARPTLPALAESYGALLGWLAVPLAVLLLAAARKRPATTSALTTIALVILAVPLVVFAFALVVSHSYATRYGVAGAFGVALLLAALAERVGPAAAFVLMATMLLGNAWRDPGEIAKPDRLQALAVVDAAPGDLPIATGSGLRFLEFAENARPAIARRLVFLDLPGVDSPDPTNRHQVERWKAIRPDLPVVDARRFVCRTPAFLLFAQPGAGGADGLPEWLAGRAAVALSATEGASLTLVRPYRCDVRQLPLKAAP